MPERPTSVSGSTARRLTEAHFQRQVLQLAGLYGWLAYHTHDSRRSQPGFPDLVLVRGPEIIFAELKTDTGRVRPEQNAWLNAINVVSDAVTSAVVDAYGEDRYPARPDQAPMVLAVLWRPRDFDVVHTMLARGRHRLPAEYANEESA